LILVVAGALRIPFLGSLPPGLFRDEVEKATTARELWHSARQGSIDQAGNFTVSRPVPFFVDAGGVKTSAIYQYLTAPVVGLFGMNPWSIRLAAALAGVGIWLAMCIIFVKRVGGITGDGVGAASELCELAMMTGVAVCLPL
jgi:4-amino-4-deoxy-L-arabinose transferase-like glycosyltransferase